MDSSIASEIYVFPHICNAKRSPAGSSISGNNFSLEINLIAEHAYTCGDDIVKECHFSAICGTYKYKSLSWNIIDKDLSASDFPYPLEKVKWDGVDKILEGKDDLIQQIMEFVHTLENVTPPFQDDDMVCVTLIFVKKVFVPPQEFEHIKMQILFNYYENIAAILWNKVCDEIWRYLGQDSSYLYEEFQCLKDFVETIVRETTSWRTNFNEDCERVLIESLIELARREFMSLPAVRSIMQYLHKADFTENELTEECSICMSRYLPDSEAYNMPCSHTFHYGCIETWLLKTPSCPMCRFKLPPTE